jgi:hypothetical protein
VTRINSTSRNGNQQVIKQENKRDVSTLQTRYPTYKLQVKTRSGVCSHALPHVLQHRTRPPSRGGLRAATCLAAPGLASQPRWALTLPCVPWLRTRGEGSGELRVLWLQILPPCWEGSGLPCILQSPMGHGTQA